LTQIELFNESTTEIPLEESDYETLLAKVSAGENVTFSLIEIVYVDETGIQEVNKQYLERDYVTDIITFSYADEDSDQTNSDIEGTLYMCAPRIIEQANELNVDHVEEFKRVFIHGLLHLCGHDDQNSDAKSQMTIKENQYLL
jgi:probable rRNA maturation factor